MSGVRTTCPYCGVGCGVSVTVADDGFKVAGDVSHPANAGRLCVKGSALGETLDEAVRLTSPVVGGARVDWERALDAVATRLEATVREHGPGSVAFYLSGQLLTEDYYVANKLMKGFVGSPHVDTNSRLCMSSAVAAHKRAFGEDLVGGNYEDLELADVVVFAGSNAAWTHPVLFQRILASRERNPDKKIVVIDTRATDTSEMADLHLKLRPGSDAQLFAGLLQHLASRGRLVDEAARVATSDALHGWAGLLPADVATACGLEQHEVVTFFEWFAAKTQVATIFSQGINQSVRGTDTGNLIINCHVASGRFNRPGATAFSVTGQPNAMGGREVGGLANQLAAHMDFDAADVDRVARFWNAPNIVHEGGYKAIDMFEAVERGEIRFLWIMATNPLVSLPDARRWEAALAACPTVVVSDCNAQTDTTRVADILLPAAGWGEKDGTVTNSERMISRQRAFRAAPGAAKPDWWIVSKVARRLGYDDAFAYGNARDVFVEHATLSGFENRGERLFDISGLASMSLHEYEIMQPVQWPVTAASPEGTARLDLPWRLIPVAQAVGDMAGDHDGSLVLNTGRWRDQWHTMTRTGISRTLLSQVFEPRLEIHPEDAREPGITEGDIVEVMAQGRHAFLKAKLTTDVRRGALFAPIHFSDSNSAMSRVDDLVTTARDPVSGQPDLKRARVTVRRLPVEQHHFVLSRRELPLCRSHYWVRHRLQDVWFYVLAGQSARYVSKMCAALYGEPDLVLEFPGGRRHGYFSGGVLEAVWFSDSVPVEVSPWWLVDRFGEHIDSRERVALLYGQPLTGGKRGEVICSCFQVTDAEILSSIGSGSRSVETLGEALRCGTNCGSCVPQLKRLLAAGQLDDQERHHASVGG